MPLMRDPQSKAVIEVHPKWIARWPSDFEPVAAPKKRPADKPPVTPVVGAIETPDGEE